MAQEINYNKFFLAAYSQGVIVMFLISTYFVYTPIVLESLKITETEFALGITVFGITNIIINQIIIYRFMSGLVRNIIYMIIN